MNELLPETLELEVEDRKADGPAMLRLRPSQREFVLHYIALGATAMHAAKAARAAGYSVNRKGVGSILLRNENIIAAIREEGAKMASSAAAEAIAVNLEIMRDPDHKDRLKASHYIGGLNGFTVAQKLTVEHGISDDTKVMLKGIKDMCRQLGLDAQHILGSAGIVDAEFTEVPQLPAPDVA